MTELPKELKGKKASEVFLEYCKPLLDELKDGTEEEFVKLEKCMTVPWTIWNSLVLDQIGRNKIAWMGSVKILSRGYPGGEKVLEYWRRRKLEAFNDYQYLMGEFKVVPTARGEFTLKMESRAP
jgi:hypothetical protein